MEKLVIYLIGGDLRSIANVTDLIPTIKTQSQFNALFDYFRSNDRLVVMFAADAIEKIALARPGFLQRHKEEILGLL